jgi:hypothetical protein
MKMEMTKEIEIGMPSRMNERYFCASVLTERSVSVNRRCAPNSLREKLNSLEFAVFFFLFGPHRLFTVDISVHLSLRLKVMFAEHCKCQSDRQLVLLDRAEMEMTTVQETYLNISSFVTHLISCYQLPVKHEHRFL